MNKILFYLCISISSIIGIPALYLFIRVAIKIVGIHHQISGIQKAGDPAWAKIDIMWTMVDTMWYYLFWMFGAAIVFNISRLFTNFK